MARDHLGQSAQALQAYDRTLSLEPGNTKARCKRVTPLRQLGRDTEAEKDKAGLQAAMPPDENATLLYNESRPPLDRGEFDRAIGLLRQATALRTGMHQAWARLSEAHFGKGKIQKAIDAINEAIRLAPDDVELYLNRGLMLIRSGDASAGLRDYRTAEHLRPGDEDARDALLPDSLVTPTPEQVEVMGYRAFIHYRTGNTRKAVPLMARVVAFESAGRPFLRDYGYMLLDVQRPQDALQPFARAFAEQPDEVDSWIGMMMASYVTGNRAGLAAQKAQFRERFSDRYTLDRGLLERLQVEEYWYSPGAHQLWRNLIAEP